MPHAHAYMLTVTYPQTLASLALELFRGFL